MSFSREFLKNKISRGAFVKLCFSLLAGLTLGGMLTKRSYPASKPSNKRPKRSVNGKYDIVAVKGEDPYQMTVKALDAIGGMGQFVKKGDIVVIKPNIGWDRGVEQAANTNPLVVAALVELCFKSGAKRVNVFDIPCNSAQRCYENSGISKAAREKGADVYFVDDWNFINANFSYPSPMEGWPIFKDAVQCDTFINVPVLKNHGLTGLTLSMKNLMGVCGGNRGQIHRDIGKKLVDLTDFINPELTVIDAYRVLTANGPSGGNLDDVILMKTVIAGTDPTLADVYAAKMVNKDPLSVPYISEAVKRNFGKSDIGKARILELAA